MNDANYVIIAKVDDNQKVAKKFADLLKNVFGTEVPESDIKKLEISEDSGNSEDEEGNETSASSVVLFVKLTTK